MNLQSHFAPMKYAQIPTNSISNHSKLIQLFEFGGAFIIPSKLCRASQDRSRFCKFMLWFNFILGLIFLFFCFKLIIIDYNTQKQKKIKIKPKTKLNHNIYIETDRKNIKMPHRNLDKITQVFHH